MNQGILQWSLTLTLNTQTSLPLSSSFPRKPIHHPTSLHATLTSLQQHDQHQDGEAMQLLPARERRKLRNERRESKTSNWKEEVETKLMKKPKKRYATWTEELNLDLLAHLGPQWWVVRVSRAVGQSQYSSERLALSLANNYPDFEFKMYIPAVQEKKILKNKSISVKPKPLYPGCVFLKCVLNKEMHDFIKEFEGIGGFIGSKVGNTKRQINKPRPVAEDDMKKIFQQAKEEQEKADLAFQELEKSLLEPEMPTPDPLTGNLETLIYTKPKSRSKKVSEPARRGRKSKFPKIGSTVRVVSGSFAEFSGIVKKVDKKNERVTLGFTLLGKETISDLDVHDIVLVDAE